MFAQAATNALQKCRERIVKRELMPGDCPNTRSTDQISKAKRKAESTIAKACGGKDKTCGTSDEGEDSLDSIGWNIGVCPDFEHRGCNHGIASCSDIAICVTCIGEQAVDQATGLYYDSLVGTDPKSRDATVKALNRCQRTIGKSTAMFLTHKSKLLQKCWEAVSMDKNAGPCPDAAVRTAIAAAKSKSNAAVCKACGGADKSCSGTDGFSAVDIGFPSTCPPVAIPGGAACARSVGTLQELGTCVDCVTEFTVDCAALAAVRGFPSAPAYPVECNQ